MTKFNEQFRPVIAGADYQQQLADGVYSEAASSFICAGMLHEAVGEHANAGWSYLKAAWLLDDAHEKEKAKSLRGRAADQFLTVLGTDNIFPEHPGAFEAVIADCLRRAGRAEEAAPIVDRALKMDCDDMIRKVLAFESILLQRGDTSCHSVEEACKASN